MNNLSGEMSDSQDFLNSPLLSSLYKNGLNSLLEHLDMKDQELHFGQAPQMMSSTGSSTCSSSSSTSSKSMMIRPELIDLWKTMGNDNSIDCDEGIGDSSPMNIWSSIPNSSSLIASRSSPSASASPTDSLLTSSNPSKNSFGLNDDFSIN